MFRKLSMVIITAWLLSPIGAQSYCVEFYWNPYTMEYLNVYFEEGQWVYRFEFSTPCLSAQRRDGNAGDEGLTQAQVDALVDAMSYTDSQYAHDGWGGSDIASGGWGGSDIDQGGSAPLGGDY
jgi:hypothetical protein